MTRSRRSLVAVVAVLSPALVVPFVACSSDSQATAPRDSGTDTSMAPTDAPQSAPDAGLDGSLEALADEDAATEADASSDVVENFDVAPDVGVPPCTATEKTARWNAVGADPIVPAQGMAGLVLSPPDDAGVQTVSLATVEEALCPGDNLGDEFGDSDFVMGWGESDQFWAHYDPSTTLVNFMVVFTGYLGTLTFHSPDNADTYVVSLALQISKNGAGFTLDWNDATMFPAEADELYRALLATFSPSTPQPSAGTTCITSMACIPGQFGDVGYLYFKAPSVAIWTASSNGAQPAPSIINRADVY